MCTDGEAQASIMYLFLNWILEIICLVIQTACTNIKKVSNSRNKLLFVQFRARADGIGSNIWRCLDIEHSQLFIQFQFKYSGIYKSISIGNYNGFIPLESHESSQA